MCTSSFRPLMLQHHVRRRRIWPQVQPWPKLCIRCKSSPFIHAWFTRVNFSISLPEYFTTRTAFWVFGRVVLLRLCLRNIFHCLCYSGVEVFCFRVCPCSCRSFSLMWYPKNEWINVCRNNYYNTNCNICNQQINWMNGSRLQQGKNPSCSSIRDATCKFMGLGTNPTFRFCQKYHHY